MNKEIKELKCKIDKYRKMEEELNSEVENKMYELNRVIDDREYAEFKIEKILKEKKEEEVSKERSSNFLLTNDDFTNALKKASLFCSADDSYLSYIKTSENQVMATSGYLGIIINTEIPKEKQNKKVHWNKLNEPFEDLVNEAQHIKMLEEVYASSKKNSKLTKLTTSQNIFKELQVDKKSIGKGGAYVISYEDINLAIDINYMDSALKTFDKNEEVKVILPSGELGALLIESELQKVIIMPIRLGGSTRYEL